MLAKASTSGLSGLGATGLIACSVPAPPSVESLYLVLVTMLVLYLLAFIWRVVR